MAISRLSSCVAVLAASACACASAPSAQRTGDGQPTTVAWRQARERLAGLRRSAPDEAHTLRIALRLRELRTGRVLEARGAVALAPPDSLRMVLLGPGGTTAVDLWSHGDRFRLSIPAAGVLERGGRGHGAPHRWLPVDFLRWWLLDPAGGKLLWYERDAGGPERFVLRDPRGGIVHLDAWGDGRVLARRSDGAGRPEERVEAAHIGCAPARYESDAGIEVTVRCEGVEPRAPRPEAFADPDAARGAP